MTRSTLVLVVSSVFGITLVPLHVRSAQTSAVCTASYAWMQNSQQDSPCLLAAEVIGACHGGNWEVPALDSQHHYTSPNSTTADLCSCSWLAYNYLNACSTCQGFQSDIQDWSSYKLACTAAGMLSTTYFPTDKIALPNKITISPWAAVDPSQWSNQVFSPTQAEQIANQGKPDIVPGAPGSSNQRSSTPVGAIAGGVVGGVAALLLAGGLAFFMVRRKRKQQRQSPRNDHTSGPPEPGHGRTNSDLSQKSTTKGVGLAYSRLHNFSAIQAPLTSPTIHTHSSSVHSLSYFGSAVGSTTNPAASMGQSMSPYPTTPSPIPVNQEDIIVPYTVPPQSMQNMPRQASDRKRADGGFFPMYDQPTSLLVNVDEPVPSRRPRFNPPEYTPYPEPGPDDSSSQIQAPTSRTRPLHSKNDSADTQGSWDSGVVAMSVVRSGQAAGRGTPVLDHVIEQTDPDSAENELTSSGSVATRSSGEVENRDVAM